MKKAGRPRDEEKMKIVKKLRGGKKPLKYKDIIAILEKKYKKKFDVKQIWLWNNY